MKPASDAAHGLGHRPVRAVVGTAGHVDHGKTTLVGDLTGMQTDRLAEERARGISIELGFAWVDTDAGRLAFVDVPGHERFVRQMIAGAAGIDFVLLVVAADEGVMPQTREHLDICELLGVSAGAVVLTKVDLVDDDWLELVREDVREAVRGTFLEDAPVFTHAAGDPISAQALTQALAELATRSQGPARSPDRPFKLSIDRVFVMRGFGTVVTGTTASGTLGVGDQVVLQPSGRTARVRGVEVHGQAVERLGPGTRAAINLQGAGPDDIGRGEVVTTRDGLVATSMIDGTFTALGRLARPVPERARVLVHVGTAQVQGTLAIVGADEVPPGGRAAVQLRLDAPVAILPGEPYVVRGFEVLEGYGKTLGGGRALTPAARRHRGVDAPAAQALIAALAGDDPRAALEGLAGFEGERGLPRHAAALAARLPGEIGALGAARDALLEAGRLVIAGDRLIHVDALDALAGRAIATLDAHHRAQPARPGLTTEELRTRVRADLPAELFAQVIARLVASGRVVASGELLARSDFRPRRSAAQERACEGVLAALREGGLTPPRVQDLPEQLGLTQAAIDDALELLLAEGAVVRVSRELVFGAAPLADLERRLVAFLEAHDTIDASQLKDLTGASRKYTIPLGEYFDRVRLTLRVGDARRLRRAG